MPCWFCVHATLSYQCSCGPQTAQRLLTVVHDHSVYIVQQDQAHLLNVCTPQVDFFDASGTLFSMANFVNNFIPGGWLALLPSSSQSVMHFQMTSLLWRSTSHYDLAQQDKNADVTLPV